jgi:thioredoxin 1
MNNDLASPHVRRLDAASFERTIQHGIVLVDFDEPWCGPCRMQLAVLENLANQIGSGTTLAEVNIDAVPTLALQYQVESIPTLVLFKDGQPLGRFVGVQHERRLAVAIKVAARS